MAEFKNGKYYPDSQYGMVGDIGNWVYNQYKGSTNPATRGSKVAATVNNKQTQFNGLPDGRNFQLGKDYSYKPTAILPSGVVPMNDVKTTAVPVDVISDTTVKDTKVKKSAPLKAQQPLVNPSAVAQTVNTADGIGFENAMSYDGNGSFNGQQFLGTGNAVSGLGVGTDASYISQLGGYMPQSAVVSQSTIPSGSAPWYSTNAGGFSDEQLAGMTPEQLIAAKGLQSNLASNIGMIGSGVSAIGGLYDIYNTYQQNKMMKDAYNTQKSELARQVQKDQAFSSNINKSGLGTRA